MTESDDRPASEGEDSGPFIADYTLSLLLDSPDEWASMGWENPTLVETWSSKGFDVFDAIEWRDVARTLLGHDDPDDVQAASLAQIWRLRGFSASVASEWAEVLSEAEADPFKVPLAAWKWQVCGFDPETTQWWAKSNAPCFSQELEFAILFRDRGWLPGQATILDHLMSRLHLSDAAAYRRAWLALDLPAAAVLNFVKAGVDPAEGPVLAAWRNKDHLLAELKARHEALPLVDEFNAMHINHLVFLMDVDEQHDKEFYEEHLFDMEDADDAARLERELGRPNADGVYLVAVVEFSADADEEQWSMVGNMLRGSVGQACERLGYQRRDVQVTTWQSDEPVIGTMPDGVRVAAIAEQVDGTSSRYKQSREPTDEERDRWADL